MPMAIPVIVAAAASVGTIAAFGGLAAIATLGTLAQIGVFALASGAGALASSLASSALGLNKPPDLGGGGGDVLATIAAEGGRVEQVRSPTAPHQYSFGRIKTAGVLRLATTRSFGGTNNQMYLIHAFCGAECHGIRGIWIGDKKVDDPVFAGLTYFGGHAGSEIQDADATFTAEIPSKWTENHRGRGICYLATKLEYSETAYGTAGVDISVMLDGITNIYDPRLGFTKWTNNWALCVAHYLMAPWGKKLPLSKIDLPTLIASANISDERVLVRHDETNFTRISSALLFTEGARALDWGDGVRLRTVLGGTLPAPFVENVTYYVIPGEFDNDIHLAATVADAFASIAIAITADPVLQQILVYWDEARYKMNGMFTSDMSPDDIIEQMKTAAAGEVFSRGGKWYVYAGAPSPLPYPTLTDDDLAGDVQYVGKRSIRDAINLVRGRFFDPDNHWQENDSPVLRPTIEMLEQDKGERPTDMQFPFTTSGRTIQRLMKIRRSLARQQESMTFPGKLTCFKLSPMDGVYVTREGRFENKPFRVIDWGLNSTGVIELLLQGHDGTEYDWTVADELETQAQSDVDIPDDADISPPATLTIRPNFDENPSTLFVEWAEIVNPFAIGYELQFKGHAATNWTTYGAIPMTVERKAGITRSPPQDFRIRTLTDAAQSGWITNLPPDPPTSLSVAGDEISWTAGSGAFKYLLFKDGVIWSETDVPPFLGLNNGSYTMRSVSATGNLSALAGPVVVSGVGTGGGGFDPPPNDPADGD